MTKEQFDRAKACPDQGVLIHLICNQADDAFYSEDPDALAGARRTVLCAETFYSSICDGGLAAWFDMDHGQLAHCGPKSLRKIGLPEYAELAERALRLHHDAELPETVLAWTPHLTRVRQQHGEEDHSERYEPLEAEFFALCHDHPGAFRRHLYDFIVRHEDELLAAPVVAA